VVCPAFGFLEAQWPLSWRGQDKRRLVLLWWALGTPACWDRPGEVYSGKAFNTF
jgi:hypothetical protein